MDGKKYEKDWTQEMNSCCRASRMIYRELGAFTQLLWAHLPVLEDQAQTLSERRLVPFVRHARGVT